MSLSSVYLSLSPSSLHNFTSLPCLPFRTFSSHFFPSRWDCMPSMFFLLHLSSFTISLSLSYKYTHTHTHLCRPVSLKERDLLYIWMSWSETFHFVKAEQMDAGIVTATHLHTRWQFGAQKHTHTSGGLRLHTHIHAHTHTSHSSNDAAVILVHYGSRKTMLVDRDSLEPCWRRLPSECVCVCVCVCECVSVRERERVRKTEQNRQSIRVLCAPLWIQYRFMLICTHTT